MIGAARLDEARERLSGLGWPQLTDEEMDDLTIRATGCDREAIVEEATRYAVSPGFTPRELTQAEAVAYVAGFLTASVLAELD